MYMQLDKVSSSFEKANIWFARCLFHYDPTSGLRVCLYLNLIITPIFTLVIKFNNLE